jgi:hypothetical protein
MSELRNKLDVAKTEYESNRYPGDLAQDLLADHARVWFRRMVLSIAAVSSIAAMVGMIWLTGHLMSRETGVPSQNQLTRITESETDQEEVVELAVPGLPEMPSATPLVPMFESSLLLPPMPSFWSNDVEQQQDTPTTREAI